RVIGRADRYGVDIVLSGPTVPASLKAIALVVEVAGKTLIDASFAGTPNQKKTVVWDGRDRFGRPVMTDTMATVRIGYVYDVYYGPPIAGSNAISFAVASTGTASIAGALNPARREGTIWRVLRFPVGAFQALSEGLGGWTLSTHHTYN